MTILSLSYEATLIFMAPKIPRKFPNILWIMPHIPMQKYCMVIWKFSAKENIFASGQNCHFVKQVYFSLICWS
jgi:hypothetical protein